MSIGYPRTGPRGGLPGHGRKIPMQRFAAPVGRPRHLPSKSKMAPWFLKSYGSRPASKRPQRLAEVA